jgi:peptidylprolyl isomerase
MRVLAAALIVGTAVAAQTTTPTTTTKKPATTTKPAAATARPAASGAATSTHRPTATTRRTPLTDPKAAEGLAAVGSMPAATGTPAPLFALKYIDTKIGTGELAQPSTPPSNVVFYTVHYTGWTTDGTKFDSSVDRGEPIVFPIGLKRVISGWDTGFEGMRVGGKRRLIIPWQLAYGAAGHPPAIPEKADLVFDIELVGQGLTQEPVKGTQLTRPEPITPVAQPGANPVNKPAERPEEHQE